MTGPLDRATRDAYERSAARWATARTPSALDRWEQLATSVGDVTGPGADLGCGPGWHTGSLPAPAVAVDAARAMLDLVGDHAPDAPRVQADLGRLPFTRAALGAVLATKAFVHLDAEQVPRALAELHRASRPDATCLLSFFGSGPDATEPTTSLTWADDDFPGRRFSLWHLEDLDAVLDGAGLTVLEVPEREAATGEVVVGPRQGGR
ncbi:MAG: class I SAM-dependent methyltransferase, partial [Actinomycetota bacterium]